MRNRQVDDIGWVGVAVEGAIKKVSSLAKGGMEELPIRPRLNRIRWTAYSSQTLADSEGFPGESFA